MKFTVFLAVSCCTMIVLVHAQSTESNNSQELLKRASAQLERLAPYRRNNAAEIVLDPGRDPGKDPESPRYNQALALELFEILPEEIKKKLLVDKRSDDKTIDVVVDSKYTDLMQERIKRSGIAGSAGFISSIASGILGGIASASGTASRGSAASLSSGSSSSSGSGGGYPVYGPPEHHAHYGEQTLDGWDLKRAILNTLLQAIKAIGGGVLALKGQLIKGGGFLISAKGRLISGTGDVISAFGKQIASSAVVAHPNPTYHHTGGYGYNTGSVQHVVEHDSGYDGLPPSHEYTSYDGHSSYGAPSDDANHAGLLIATPTKAENHHDHHHHHEEASLDIRKPSADHVSDLNDSFGGPAKGTLENEQHGVVTSDHHDNHLDPLYPPLGQTPHTYPLDINQELPNYAVHTSTKESLTSPLKVQGVVSLLNNPANNVQIQQSVEYPPLQSTHYTPSSATTNTNQFDILKIPLLDHQQHSHYPTTTYQLPKLPAQSDFYNLPDSYGGLSYSQDPLKTPVLNTGSASYWQNQVPYYAGAYDVYGHLQRRNSILKRRYAHDFGWRPKGFRPLGRG